MCDLDSKIPILWLRAEAKEKGIEVPENTSYEELLRQICEKSSSKGLFRIKDGVSGNDKIICINDIIK